MSDVVKVALIFAITAMLGLALYLYFSPYHSCVRGLKERVDNVRANIMCARGLGGVNGSD